MAMALPGTDSFTEEYWIQKMNPFFGLKLQLLIFLSFCCLKMLAQDSNGQNPINNQFWIDYNLSYALSEKLDLYGGIGFRTISPHEWNRYAVTPAIKYEIPKWIFKKLKYREELHGGIGLFYTTNFNAANRLEIRPFQGYRFEWPDRTRVRFRHYIRLEERFDINTVTWINTFGLRFRYMAELTIKLQGDVFKRTKGVYIPVSMELYWNLIGTKQFNDKLRITPGIGYGFSKKWRGEFSIAYHYGRNTVRGEFESSEIVYRIRAFYKLN